MTDDILFQAEQVAGRTPIQSCPAGMHLHAVVIAHYYRDLVAEGLPPDVAGSLVVAFSTCYWDMELSDE